ncbi:MAG: hypothetical protein JOZ46_12005 [Candidatus Dormibacteraeota bacterium]|nr:hypothetical protein [Candidatus Dormibacteraeota bacterium]MBV9526524.1 hypothetical protein [Candidatus Dormibacteraeota bacterium]
MAQAVEQAQKQRELSKEALAADLGRFEAKVRSELDVKARLRRDGLRIAAIAGGALLLVGGLIVLRARLRKRGEGDDEDPATIEDLAEELREIRKELEKQRKGGSGAQKLLLRGLTAAGSAGGSYVARQMMKRRGAEEESEQASAG